MLLFPLFCNRLVCAAHSCASVRTCIPCPPGDSHMAHWLARQPPKTTVRATTSRQNVTVLVQGRYVRPLRVHACRSVFPRDCSCLCLHQLSYESLGRRSSTDRPRRIHHQLPGSLRSAGSKAASRLCSPALYTRLPGSDLLLPPPPPPPLAVLARFPFITATNTGDRCLPCPLVSAKEPRRLRILRASSCPPSTSTLAASPMASTFLHLRPLSKKCPRPRTLRPLTKRGPPTTETTRPSPHLQMVLQLGPSHSVDDAPLSPAGSGRQASIRRLFSRNMLSASYTDGRLTSIDHGGRPDSRGATSVAYDRRLKRSSGWFRRLRGADAKRASFSFDDVTPIVAPPNKVWSHLPSRGLANHPRSPWAPLPPMIPELAALESGQGSLGSDLFKNIK